jgi:hypothetical protein
VTPQEAGPAAGGDADFAELARLWPRLAERDRRKLLLFARAVLEADAVPERRAIGPEDEARGGHEAPGGPGPTVPGLERGR